MWYRKNTWRYVPCVQHSAREVSRQSGSRLLQGLHRLKVNACLPKTNMFERTQPRPAAVKQSARDDRRPWPHTRPHSVKFKSSTVHCLIQEVALVEVEGGLDHIAVGEDLGLIPLSEDDDGVGVLDTCFSLTSKRDDKHSSTTASRVAIWSCTRTIAPSYLGVWPTEFDVVSGMSPRSKWAMMLLVSDALGESFLKELVFVHHLLTVLLYWRPI